MAFALPPLPYPPNSFGDTLSAETFAFHHGKHHQAYVDKANELVAAEPAYKGLSLVALIELAAEKDDEKLFHQVAQVWNHTFYWHSLTPEKAAPTGRLLDLINSGFGSLDALLDRLGEEAEQHFASGWAALNLQDGALQVTSYHDADTPVAHGATPLLILDLWEHAYYIDYRNARPDYVEALLKKAINWDFASQNLDGDGARRADQPG